MTTHGVRDGVFPAEFPDFKGAVEAPESGPAPDLVFTRRRANHQDHRQFAELTRNTFRGTAVLEYEIPKHDPDPGNRNLSIPLTRAQAGEKAAILIADRPSRRHRAWFTPDTSMGLTRPRGVRCSAPSRLAEGFHAPELRL